MGNGKVRYALHFMVIGVDPVWVNIAAHSPVEDRTATDGTTVITETLSIVMLTVCAVLLRSQTS